MKIGCLYQGKFKLAEGPVWCDRTRSVWWVNMVDVPAVYRLPWGADEPQEFIAPLAVTGIALSADNFVIVGSVGGLLRLDPRTGVFAPLLRLDGCGPDNRCNEIAVDHHGNLWVSTMTNNLTGSEVDPTAGAVFRIAPDGHQVRVIDHLGIPNTLVWDAEGWLVTADSLTGVIRRIRLGSAGEVLQTALLHGPVDIGVPDGSALAADGTLWNARWSAGCLIGIAPNGAAVAQIKVPGGNITSACFAGPDLDTLVVTTSNWGLTDDELGQQPMAGGIFGIEGVGKGVTGARFAAAIGHWSAVTLD